MIVYMVRQTQPEADLYNYTIAVYDNYTMADFLMKALNKKYSKGVEFDEDYHLMKVKDYDICHYYDIKAKTLNPELEQFL